MLSLHHPGSTLLHRTPAWLKLALLALIGAGVMIHPSPWVAGATLARSDQAWAAWEASVADYRQTEHRKHEVLHRTEQQRDPCQDRSYQKKGEGA